jgi:putative ABC transport system ATP-binding protein
MAVKLRPEVEARLAEAGLDKYIHRFHPEKFNPVSPLGSNLLYALPIRLLPQGTLASDGNFLRILREEGIDHDLAGLSANVIEGLMATFGKDGTDHPLFRRLNLDEELYYQLSEIVEKRREVGDDGLAEEDFALMMTVPFAFSAEQIGPAFTDDLKEKVLKIRKKNAAHMLESMGNLFESIDPDRYIPVMTLMGNAIFGRISGMAGANEDLIVDLVGKVFEEHGLRRMIAQSIFDLEATQGGENLSAGIKERISLTRAGIKKPDVLILGNALASSEGEARTAIREKVSALLPDSTKIFIETSFRNPQHYDLYVEIANGRIDGVTRDEEPTDEDAKQDLNRKLKVVAQAELFQDLDMKQQRIIAFSSKWYKAGANEVVFSAGEPADAVYLCVKGAGALYFPNKEGESIRVTEVKPGRIIGDLAIFLGKPRPLELMTTEESVFLRIGAQEYMDLIEHDGQVATSLLKTVAGHLESAGNWARSLREYATEQGVDFSGLEDWNNSRSNAN